MLELLDETEWVDIAKLRTSLAHDLLAVDVVCHQKYIRTGKRTPQIISSKQSNAPRVAKCSKLGSRSKFEGEHEKFIRVVVAHCKLETTQSQFLYPKASTWGLEVSEVWKAPVAMRTT